MKTTSTGATARGPTRTRIIGRCRQVAEGAARRSAWTRKQKSPGKPGLRLLVVSVADRFGTTRGISSEMIVDANLDGVELAGTGIEGDSEQGIGLAVEVDEHVLGLGGPVRREHVFEAAADGVSGMDMAVRNGKAERGSGSRQLVVSPGITALGVEQCRIHRDAHTAGNASQCVHLVFHRAYRAVDDSRLAFLDAGTGGIDLDTEHELAARELPVVADRATSETAAVVAVKGIAAHRADIEAGPVVR